MCHQDGWHGGCSAAPVPPLSSPVSTNRLEVGDIEYSVFLCLPVSSFVLLWPTVSSCVFKCHSVFLCLPVSSSHPVSPCIFLYLPVILCLSVPCSSVETTLSPILELTKELLEGMETLQHHHQHQGEGEREENGHYGAGHDHTGAGHDHTGAGHDHNGAGHDHNGAVLDPSGAGHDHNGADHDHHGAEHDHGHTHKFDQQHLEREFHRHMEHEHRHEDGSIHAHLLPIYDSIKNEQVPVAAAMPAMAETTIPYKDDSTLQRRPFLA